MPSNGFPSGGSSSGGGGGFFSSAGNYADILGPLLGMMGGGGQQQVLPPPPTGLLGPIPQVGQSSDTPQVIRDPEAGTLDEAIDLPASEKLPEKKSMGDRVGGFFGNIDETFQSPSKVIGLGLLNRQDPNLALAALVASGLLGGQNGSV